MSGEEKYEEGALVPMEFQGGWETFKGLPGRLITLLWKLVSFQGVVLGLATWLKATDRIESYAWLVVIVFVLFGRVGLDFLKEIKK